MAAYPLSGATTGPVHDAGPVLFLTGPTATGKTDLAVDLAARIPVSVVSVDSAMVYREMDIGTAKPDAGVRSRVPHALIDILDPAERYSAARFRNDALRHIRRAWQVGRLPLLVGGSLLYYRALQHGLSPLPESDPQIRAGLEQRLASIGIAAMHRWLASVDPRAAGRIHPNDPQRILRALEVFLISGRPMTELYACTRAEPLRFDLLKVVLDAGDRGWLHRRIEQRFHSMLEAGFEAEVLRLMTRGDLHPGLPSMRAVGYRQMWRHLAGEIGRERMVAEGIAATRQFARRQRTWLRGERDARWFDCTRPGAVVDAVADWLAQSGGQG